MSSYSNTFNGKGRDAARAKFTGKDLDDQFDAIATASAQKADKVIGATSGNIATLDASGNLVDSGKTFTSITPFLHIQDQKPAGTSGGSAVAGVNVRDLNTVLTNEISGASLASNQITLPAGTYYVEASAPLFRVNRGMLRLYNSTTSSYILDGISTFAYSAYSGHEITACSGKITLSTTSTLVLHNLCELAYSTHGLGVDSSVAGTIDHNTYTDVKIWKVA